MEDLREKHVAALFDGPRPLEPVRVTERSVTFGKRVAVFDAPWGAPEARERMEWRRGYIAASDPHWFDPTHGIRWKMTDPVPPGASPADRVAVVAVVPEAEWWRAAVLDEVPRPPHKWYASWLVWLVGDE